MKFNSVGTAERIPQLHKTINGLRGLCGVKVIRRDEVQATTMGEAVAETGHEPCVECNVRDKDNANN